MTELGAMELGVAHYEQKKSSKGEDFVLAEERVAWSWPDGSDGAFSVFAVFDGHGGAAAAAEAKSVFVDMIKEELSVEAENAKLDHGQAESSFEVCAPWDRVLPSALRSTFDRLNTRLCDKFSSSGTTATVSIIPLAPLVHHQPGGVWARIYTANVGDSHAFADFSGHKVVQLNEDHRLQNNNAEQNRIISAGGEVARAGNRKDDKSDPLRLWPGGLMMSRSLGDKDAIHSISTAAVSCLTIRLREADDVTRSSCRVLIASDGLWDVFGAKQSFQLVRRKNPQAASQLLASQAYTKAGKDRDDISVIVIDITECSDQRKRLASACSKTSIVSTTSTLSRRGSFNSHMFDDHESERCQLHAFFAQDAQMGPIQQVSNYEVELLETQRIHNENNARIEKERQEIEEALRLSKEVDEALAVASMAQGEGDDQDEWQTVSKRSSYHNDDENNAANDDSDNQGWVSVSSKKSPKNKTKGSSEETQKDQAEKKKKKKKKKKKDNGKDRKTKQDSNKKEKLGPAAPGPTAPPPPSDSIFMDTPAASSEFEASTNGVPTAMRSEVCNLFQKGKCRRGNRCKYSHHMITQSCDLVQEQQNSFTHPPAASFQRAPDNSDPIVAALDNVAAMVVADKEILRAGAENSMTKSPTEPMPTCDMVEQEPPKPLSRKKRMAGVCFAFKRGSCKFGDECPYKHTIVPPTNSNPPAPNPPAKSDEKKQENGKRGRKKPIKSYDLFIFNLDADRISKSALREYFEKYGAVKAFNVKWDRNRGYGFCTFVDPSAAKPVLEATYPHSINGATFGVKKFEAK